MLSRKRLATSLVVSCGSCIFFGLHFSACAQGTACETCPVDADGDSLDGYTSPERAGETARADYPVSRREVTLVRRENPDLVAPPTPVVDFGSAHFSVQIIGELSLPQEPLGQVFDQIFEYVSGDVSGEFRRPISLSLLARSRRGCPVRGTAYIDSFIPQVARIQLFLEPEPSLLELFAILAHEIGHFVIAYEYPDVVAAGPLFAEGLATWTAGAYWTRYLGATSLSAYVREVLESGRYAGIDAENSGRRVMETLIDPQGGTDCPQLRDQAYTEWAGFLEYLSSTYGNDRLHLLTRLSADSPGESPPFFAVYGRTAAELERDWIQFLLQ